MGFHGFFNEDLWIFMGFYGFFMRIYGCLWVFMGVSSDFKQKYGGCYWVLFHLMNFSNKKWFNMYDSTNNKKLMGCLKFN